MIAVKRFLGAALLMGISAGTSSAVAEKLSECTKIDICYCVESTTKATIDKNIAFFREQIAGQRKAGKMIGYISVPLSPVGGGVFHINAEVAASVKTAVEQRFGSDQIWLLNPGAPESFIPKGSGADYMLMWTSILEGADGMGDVDLAYFVGPQDFNRFFGLDGHGDMATLEKYFEKRLQTDAELKKAVEKGLTRSAFRNYYALKASVNISRGARDEWNIIRTLNERRRDNESFGIGNQIAVLFDGHGVSPADFEGATSQGYAGRCLK